jgi:hypothetical protein
MELNLDLDPILPSSQPEFMPDFVNSRGQQAARSTTGGWTSALFIIGTSLETCSIFVIKSVTEFPNGA